MDKGGDPKTYIKTLVFVFIALGAFIVAIISSFFGGVGLYFGEGIVEQDVFTDKYKYECLTNCDGTGTPTYNESAPLQSWTDYQAFRTDINETVPLYINATAVIFALLGLVFLFLALRSSGLWGSKKGSKKDEY